MPIITACTCGKKLRTRDDLAGKRIQCPACGMILTVAHPVNEQTLADAADDEKDTVELSAEHTRLLAAAKDLFWFSPQNVIALTDASIYVAECDAAAREDARRALENGEPAWKVLKDAKSIIALDEVEKVESDLRGASIAITWRPSKGRAQTETTICCADFAARDAILEALHERLGKGWKLQETEASRLRAATLPLFTGSIVFVLSVGLSFFNPFVASIVVLLGLASCGPWLVARVRTPPVLLTIIPAKK
jgi:hypothetical protein